MRNANLSDINAKFASFYGAYLRNANFSYADISNADFCHADTRGTNWTGVIFTKDTKCLPDVAINSALNASKKEKYPTRYYMDPMSGKKYELIDY